MLTKWCALVFVLGTMTTFNPAPVFSSDLTFSKNHQSANSDQGGEFSSSELLSFSGNSDEPEDESGDGRNRRKVDLSDGLMLKVKLADGSYLYRKVTIAVPVPVGESSDGVTRVARGYAGSKASRKGYGYKKPKQGYVYKKPTTTTTRAPPLAEESEEKNDSEFITPDENPDDVNAERVAEITPPPPADDPWDIRDSVPGEPGKDYAVYGRIPQTNFTCEGRTPGFYSDPEAGCQVFHRCTDDPWYTGQVRVTMDSFLCPNGSLFNQQIYTCDWWGNVDCETSPDFYQLNDQIGQLEETKAGTLQYVQFSGIRVPPPPGQKRNSPAIIPKSKRGPLPEQYRSTHKGDQDYSGKDRPDRTEGPSVGFTGEDPDGLGEEFGRGRKQFGIFRADGKGVINAVDRDGSSQTLKEVSASPPRVNKARKSKSKKSKSKTTTTTTPEPEEVEDDEEEDEDNTNEVEDDEEDDEVPEATNISANVTGLIVSRGPIDGDEEGEGQNITPKTVILPPTSEFVGEPVDGVSSTKGGEETYLPPQPSTEGPTYVPPTSPAPTGYSYPRPDNAYLPPQHNGGYQAPGYLPPNHHQNNGAYLPPPQNHGGYQSTPNNAYLPPNQNQHSGAYLPPPQANQGGYRSPPQNAYLPPNQNQHSGPYLPPPQANQGGYHSHPQNAYLPPNQNHQSGAYLPPPQANHGGYQSPQQNAYLPPNQNQQSGAYLPPSQSNQGGYQQPQNAYLPPNQNSGSYHQPKPHTNTYLPPQPEGHSYGPPKVENAYLPPKQESHSYGPPKAENAYLPPKQENQSYGPPKAENAYLPPKQESQSYGPPKAENAYLPPKQEGYSHGPPKAENAYLPPKPEGHSYGPPRAENAYLPPKQEGYSHGPPKAENAYLPPKPEGHSYGPPKAENAYLPPQTPNQYLPPQQNNYYLPPNPNNNNQGYVSGGSPPTATYLPPTAPTTIKYEITHGGLNTYTETPQSYYRKPSTGYGAPPPTPVYSAPPSTNYGQPDPQPNNQYLPPSHNHNHQPQQPSNHYLPSPQQPSQGYSNNHPHEQNRKYLPPPTPPQQHGYTTSHDQNYPASTVQHWPAKYDYEAPTSPASVQKYSVPNHSGPPQSYNHQQPSYHPDRATGLSLPTNNQNSYNNDRDSYSTIPSQTPPPREKGSSNQKSFLEFIPVPLVSSRHSVQK